MDNLVDFKKPHKKQQLNGKRPLKKTASKGIGYKIGAVVQYTLFAIFFVIIMRSCGMI